MKEKFTKLFGALILVALVLGLVMPFQTAAAEEITGTATLTVAATEGVTGLGGVQITLTDVEYVQVSGDGSYFKLARSTTESGPRTPITVPAAVMLAPITVTDTTAVAGTEYWYWGNICDPTSCSATVSDTGWRFVDGGSAGTPLSADGVAAYDRITINITAGTSVMPTGGSYVIYRGDDGAADADFSELASITALTYADLTAEGRLLDGTPAVAYDYAVDLCGVDKCVTDNSTGTWAVATGHDTRLVPVMSTVAATKGSVVGKVDVTWTAVTGANMYYGWRSFGATVEPATPVAFPGTATGGSDLWAVAGRTYTYHVYACSLGTENCTAPKTDTGFIVGAQPVVAGLTATDGTYTDALGHAGILVTWPAITWPLLGADVEYYNLYRSDDAAGNNNVVVVTEAAVQVEGAVLAYEDLNVDIAKDYYYWVVACDEDVDPDVCGLPSNIDGGWAPIPVPSVTLTSSTTGVSATWTNVDINATYLGFRSPTSSFSAAIPAGGVAIPGLSGTDTSGTVGVTYWYFVKACIGSRCSAPSTAVSGLKLLP